MRRAGLVCLVSLAACVDAPSPRSPESAPLPPPVSSQPVQKREPAAALPSPPDLSGAKPGSLLSRIDQTRLRNQLRTTRAINISLRCSFRDETGYNGSARIDIVNNEVRSVATDINIPGIGVCRFDNRGFRQTLSTPSIELRHPDDGCTVRIWEEGPQLTVAYSSCAARCDNPEAFRHVWPVLVDRSSGKCD